jgi:hypothetical protein
MYHIDELKIDYNLYFINVFVANLGSTAGKFLIWKENGGRGERERERKKERVRHKGLLTQVLYNNKNQMYLRKRER